MTIVVLKNGKRYGYVYVYVLVIGNLGELTVEQNIGFDGYFRGSLLIVRFHAAVFHFGGSWNVFDVLWGGDCYADVQCVEKFRDK